MSLPREASKLVFSATDRLLKSPEGPRILIYHQVGAGLGRQLEVNTEDFVAQLDYLESNYEVVDLETSLVEWESPDSSRLAVLTFDDGYRDTFTTAFPRLKERGLRFTLYLATAGIEGGRGSPGAEPLTWSEVNEMLESGLMTIGAHTHSHADLRDVTPDEAALELDTSSSLIEQRTGLRPKHFAYPWGYWSEKAHELVEQRYASAVLGGSPRAHRPFDPHRLPRFPVQLSDGLRWFPSRMRGGLLLEERLRRRLRGYRGP